MECIFETNQICNLSCLHCYANKDENLLTTEQIFFIIDKLKNFNVSDLIILGGEPCLRKDIYEIIEYSLTNIKNVTIQTNGTLKTFLSPYKCNVSVSFEYPEKKQNDAIRITGSKKNSAFEMAIRKIRSLTNNKVCRFTLYSDTDIFKCLVMAEMYECNSVFVPLIPIGKAKNMTDKIPGEEKIAETLYIVKEFNIKSRFHHEVQIPQNYLFDKELYLKNAKTFKKRGRICSAGIHRIFINSKGDVFPCPYLNFYCGNILKDNISFIKNKLQEFNVKMAKKKLSGNCAKCFFGRGGICHGGCLAYSMSKPTINQPNCPANFLINNYNENIRNIPAKLKGGDN